MALAVLALPARVLADEADVRADADHVGTWTESKFTSDSTDKMMDGARNVGGKASAGVSAAGAEMDLAAYKLRPTDTNKADAKAALMALSQKIEVPRGPRRENAAWRRSRRRGTSRQGARKAQGRVEARFNKARFDARTDSVQSKWNDFRN